MKTKSTQQIFLFQNKKKTKKNKKKNNRLHYDNQFIFILLKSIDINEGSKN